MLDGAKMLMDPLVLKKKMNRYGNAGDLAVLNSLLNYITELASRTSQDKDKTPAASDVTSHRISHSSKHLSTIDDNCSSTAKRPTKFQLLQSRFMNPNRAAPIKRTREVGRLIFKEKQSVTRVSTGPKIYRLDRAKEKKEDTAEENKRATAADRVKWTHPSGKNTVKNILRKFMAAEEKAQEKLETCKERHLPKNLPKIISKNSVLSKLKEKFEQTSSLCSVTKLNSSLTPTNVKSRKKDPKIRQICKAKILELQDDTKAATDITHPASHYLACTEDSLPLFHTASFISYPLSMCNTVSISCFVDSKIQTRKVLVNSTVLKDYEGQDNDMTLLPQTSQNHLIDDAKPGVPAIAAVLGEAHISDSKVPTSSDACESNFMYTVNGDNRIPGNLVALVGDERTSNKTLDIPVAESRQSNSSYSVEIQKPLKDMHRNVGLDISLEKENITVNGTSTPMSVTSAGDDEATHEKLAMSRSVCKATKHDVTEIQKTGLTENINFGNEMPQTKMANVVHEMSTKMTFDIPVTHNTTISNSCCPGIIESDVREAQQNSTEVYKVPMTENKLQQVRGNINPVPEPTEPLTSDRKNELQADLSLRRSKFLGSHNKEPGISVQDGPERTLPTAEVCEAPKANDNCKGIFATKIDFTNQVHEFVPALVSSPASCDNSALVHLNFDRVRQKEEYTSEDSVAESSPPHHVTDSSKTEALKNLPFLAPPSGTTASPQVCLSQSESGDTLPNNIIDQKIILVETVSEMIPSLILVKAKAFCNVETPIETAQTVLQTQAVQEAVLAGPGNNNGSRVNSKVSSTLENGRIQSLHIYKKPLSNSKTSGEVTTNLKDNDSTNEKLPKFQMTTKSEIRKRKPDQSLIEQGKKDKVTGNITTLPQHKSDKNTVSASPLHQDNNKSIVNITSLEDSSDNNPLNVTPQQDNKPDNRNGKATPVQTNKNGMSTMNITPHQNNQNDKKTGNIPPLLGSNVDKNNMVKSLQQDKIDDKRYVNETPIQPDDCDRRAVYKTPQQKDKKDKITENETTQQQYTNDKSSEIETCKKHEQYHKSTGNETPKKQDQTHNGTVNKTPKNQDKNHKSTVNETPKQQDKSNKSTRNETPKQQLKYPQSPVNETPKQQDKSHWKTENETPKKQDKTPESPVHETPKQRDKDHKSTVNETPKNQDKNHKSTVNETPKQQDKSNKSTRNETPMQQLKYPQSPVNETPKQQDKSHRSTVTETPKQQDKNPKIPVNETPKQHYKDHQSTANETQQQEKNHKSTLNETPKKQAKNHKSTVKETPKQQDKRDTSTVNRSSGNFCIMPHETVEHKQVSAGTSAPSLQSSSPQDCKPISKDSVSRLPAAKYIAESYGEDNITTKETFKPLIIRASDTFKRET